MVQICETERLIVRRLSLEDVPALTEILSDPEVMKHSVRGVCDEAATRKFIEWCLACYESQGVGPWALIEKKASELIGFCGVGPEMVADVEEINLGYRLARRYWNKGLASEAARAVLNYAFEKRLFHSVVVIIEPEHVASLKVAEKAGFSSFDVLEFHGRPVRLYRLTSEQWETLHNNAMHATSACMAGVSTTILGAGNLRKVLMSACLLGKSVRYDGGSLSVKDQIIERWISEGRVVSVCPEVEAGMSIPRKPAEIFEGSGNSVLDGETDVVEKGGNIVTDDFIAGASIALELCKKFNIEIAVLAESSPSCGSSFIYGGSFSGNRNPGMGVTAALLRRHGIQVFSQHEIADANKAIHATSA